MKAVVDAKEFSSALERASTAARKSRVPVLEAVCIRFTGSKCFLTGTDLESWVIAEIPARGDIFTCAFYNTKDAVKVCRYFDGELTVNVVDKDDAKRPERHIELITGTRSARFEALSADEVYPDLPVIAEDVICTTSASSLLERINRVSYAIRKRSEVDNRPDLSCVQFRGSQIYALDGTRAAWVTDPALNISFPILLDAASLAHLKLFGDKDITVCKDKNTVQFVGETTQLICRIVHTTPYDLGNVVPTTFRDEFEVRRKDFLRELDYLKGVMPQKGCPYAVLSNGKLSLMKYPERCCTRLQLIGTCKTRLAFDIHHVVDALKQFSGEEWVKVKISGQNSPIVIEAEGRSDHALVLPVKLRETAAA